MIESVTLGWRFGSIQLPAVDRYIREAIEVTGEYCGAEIDLYQAILRPGGTALDIGANVGVFSVAMALAVGTSGRVLAFEPQPPIFLLLERNLAAHGLTQAEAHRAIVFSSEGESEFLDMRTPPPGRLVNFSGFGIGTRTYGDFGGTTATPVRTVDGLSLDHCDLIKVDVEGAESHVLAGAPRTLAACRPVLSVECDRPEPLVPWIDRLLADGYRLWRFRGSNMRTPNPRRAPIAGHATINVLMLLAIPSERMQVMERVDRTVLQPIPDRATYLTLSERIQRDAG